MLPKFLDITVEGTDQTQIFRALMCLYLATSAFWAIAAFKPDWQRAAVIWAVFFSSFARASAGCSALWSTALPAALLDLYLGLEIIGGLLGLGSARFCAEGSRSKR